MDEEVNRNNPTVELLRDADQRFRQALKMIDGNTRHWVLTTKKRPQKLRRNGRSPLRAHTDSPSTVPECGSHTAISSAMIKSAFLG
jgi:hypothetical protein